MEWAPEKEEQFLTITEGSWDPGPHCSKAQGGLWKGWLFL